MGHLDVMSGTPFDMCTFLFCLGDGTLGCGAFPHMGTISSSVLSGNSLGNLMMSQMSSSTSDGCVLFLQIGNGSITKTELNQAISGMQSDQSRHHFFHGLLSNMTSDEQKEVPCAILPERAEHSLHVTICDHHTELSLIASRECSAIFTL